MTEAPLPRVAVVSCGGTIASTRGPAAVAATPTLSAADLVAALPELAGVARVEPVPFLVKASPDLTLADVLALHGLLEQVVAAGADGVVVTMGTDTLEEVAYALDLLWHHHVPLVVTGALRNTSKPSGDGPANLLGAVTAASCGRLRGLGAVVAVNDELHAARHVTKTHTGNLAAFASPETGPLGSLSEGRVTVRVVPAHPGPRVVAGPRAPGRVALLTLAIGDDGGLLPAVLDGDYDGLVVAGFPGGHVSHGFATHPALASLLQRVPVVLASRAPAGQTLRVTYSGFAGAETELLGRGMLPAPGLDALKARVLLSLLATHGRDGLGAAFSRSLAEAPAEAEG